MYVCLQAGLFVALKLVALAQAGKDINMTNIHSEAPPPKVVCIGHSIFRNES